MIATPLVIVYVLEASERTRINRIIIVGISNHGECAFVQGLNRAKKPYNTQVIVK